MARAGEGHKAEFGREQEGGIGECAGAKVSNQIWGSLSICQYMRRNCVLTNPRLSTGKRHDFVGWVMFGWKLHGTPTDT